MFYNWDMDTEIKLQLLADNASLEPGEERRGEAPSSINQLAPCGHSPAELKRVHEQVQSSNTSLKAKQDSLGIHHAVMPGGKRVWRLGLPSQGAPGKSDARRVPGLLAISRPKMARRLLGAIDTCITNVLLES